MGIETGDKITDLNPLWPLGNDPKSQGDDHIRLIKTVLGNLIGDIYPVGAIYVSVNAAVPDIFTAAGQVWEAFGAGRALVGVGTADGEAWTVEQTKGNAKHTLTTAEMPTHSHGVGSLAASTVGNHSHGSGSLSNATNGAHTHAISAAEAQNTDLDNSGSGVQRLTHLRDGAIGSNNGSTTSNGNHSHVISGSTASAGSHTHDITGSTGNAGSGGSHNNIQPSIAVYLFKRTA